MASDTKAEIFKRVEFNLIWLAVLNAVFLLMVFDLAGAVPNLKEWDANTAKVAAYFLLVSYVLVMMEIFLVYRSGIFYISYFSYRWFHNKHYYIDVLKELVAKVKDEKGIDPTHLPKKPREYEELYYSLKRNTLQRFYEKEGVIHNPINMHFMWLITWETALITIACWLMPETYRPTFDLPSACHNFPLAYVLAVLLFVTTYWMDMNSARQEFNLFNTHRRELLVALKERFETMV